MPFDLGSTYKYLHSINPSLVDKKLQLAEATYYYGLVVHIGVPRGTAAAGRLFF